MEHRRSFPVGRDREVDEWFGWLERHYGPVVEQSMTETAAGVVVIARTADDTEPSRS